MLEVPITPVPAQIVRVVLADQNCQFFLYQKEQGMFFDANVNGIDISSGILAHDAVALIPQAYSGFKGNLMFVDSHGDSDPEYSGLGDRYSLIYLDDEEYALVR